MRCDEPIATVRDSIVYISDSTKQPGSWLRQVLVASAADSYDPAEKENRVTVRQL